jgi:hypothetical protein
MMVILRFLVLDGDGDDDGGVCGMWYVHVHVQVHDTPRQIASLLVLCVGPCFF